MGKTTDESKARRSRRAYLMVVLETFLRILGWIAGFAIASLLLHHL
jgi:hypothetical protein